MVIKKGKSKRMRMYTAGFQEVKTVGVITLI